MSEFAACVYVWSMGTNPLRQQFIESKPAPGSWLTVPMVNSAAEAEAAVRRGKYFWEMLDRSLTDSLISLRSSDPSSEDSESVLY